MWTSPKIDLLMDFVRFSLLLFFLWDFLRFLLRLVSSIQTDANENLRRTDESFSFIFVECITKSPGAKRKW